MEFTINKVILLKAIFALGIVLHHLAIAGVGFLAPFYRWGPILVSFFFFISGYGLGKSFIRRGKAYLNDFIKEEYLNRYLFLLL